MFKRNELINADSCFNKARMHEPLFVLLGRDEAASATIRFWIAERIRLKLNREEDKQIQEAFDAAIRMATKFKCAGCGWEGPYYKASKQDTEPPSCPVCG